MAEGSDVRRTLVLKNGSLVVVEDNREKIHPLRGGSSMKEEESNWTTKTTLVVVGLLLIPPGIAAEGYVLMKLAGWFVPVTLGLWQSCGLSLGARFLRYNSAKAEKEDIGKTVMKQVTYLLFLCPAVLGIAWILHQLARG
jgi:hypothetical protein